MFRNHKRERIFLEELCAEYHEKILRYLYHSIGDENAARDCAQEVFLIACRKSEELQKHPNPGGFLFQTAKNLARKTRRENFTQLIREISVEHSHYDIEEPGKRIEEVLDRQIDEYLYIESVLSKLSDEKRSLYKLYYINHQSMAEIAQLFGVKEPAIRMRYVRLRQEIRDIVADIVEESFHW